MSSSCEYKSATSSGDSECNSALAADSFFFAGDIGGEIIDLDLAEFGVFEIVGSVAEEGVSSGECCSSNSNLLNLSQRSGVLTASGWFGGRQTSPTETSAQGIP